MVAVAVLDGLELSDDLPYFIEKEEQQALELIDKQVPLSSPSSFMLHMPFLVRSTWTPC
jgi:hypothetical protein